MTVVSYDDLKPLGQIIYARREDGAITNATVQLYASKVPPKIPQDNADFIILTFP